MWKLLYQLASPKMFYQISGRVIPWVSSFAFIALFVGIIWGLFFTPPDYQQGDAFRIIYVHVPSAFMSMSIYAFMGFLALLLLIWRIKLAGIILNICAELGALMAFLSLVTGSIWGKPMWGTWWIWDARLTSELILFFLYAAIIVVGNAYVNKEKGDKIVAILTLVGLIDLPIIHYSVYWWNTLHQGSTLAIFAKPKIDSSMLYPLLLMILGFALYSMLTILLKTRNELLVRGCQQRWVKKLVEGGVL
jgi:heme exporter protein C